MKGAMLAGLPDIGAGTGCVIGAGAAVASRCSDAVTPGGGSIMGSTD
ncbi:hypothetical protein [Arthrobacter sp. PAMC25564]|nr:hypothetical protein [Arthrobacter sp. PAMC25564]